MKINYRKYIKENQKDFFEYFDTYNHNRNEQVERSRKIFEMYCDNVKVTQIARHYSVTKQNIDCMILRYAIKFYYSKN